MKIGIDGRMYGKSQSGIGTYIQELTNRIFLLDQANDYYLFLLEPTFSSYQVPHDNIHKIKVTSRWYGYPEQTKFLYDLYQHKLDLMHFPHFNAPILYNRRRLTTIHDIIPKFFPGHKLKSWLRKKAYDLTIKSSLAKAAKIITISHHTELDLINYYQVSPQKIEVIYLGVGDHFKIILNYDKIKELKDRYNISKPFIFFISVWRNHKNFEGLINAFAILKNLYHLDYQLVLGGMEDPHYPKIRQAIEQSPFKKDIIVPGFISDEELPLFYNAAKLFAIPSFYEGFGLIGLEAMACNIPVVSSDAASLPEILADAALYFDPHNPEEMAATINTVANDPHLQEQLKIKGLNLVKKYSWQETAQKTLSLYQQILSS